jgi:hypothetical protein
MMKRTRAVIASALRIPVTAYGEEVYHNFNHRSAPISKNTITFELPPDMNILHLFHLAGWKGP